MNTEKPQKKNGKKRLVLLDAHALLHRAYHALPEFTSSQGVPTGGLFGFISMILRIATEWKPDYLVACYDLPQKTFRHEAYDAYKGKRSKTDDALVSQIIASRLVCEKLNIPIYDTPGFEADDMLGTIVEQEKNNKELEILIATGDMDTLQLVDGKKVRVFTLKKGINDTVVYDEDMVNERYHFPSEMLPDYKGLRGDPSDNIIGIPGIGEKTATELLVKFGTIETIYKKLKKNRQDFLDQGIKERIVKLLEDNEENALFSKTLATIRRDAPIEFKLPTQEWLESLNMEIIEPVLREYEFKSLVPRFKNLLSGGAVPPPRGGGGEGVVVEKEETAEQDLPKKLKIAMWLLNSDLTDPVMDDAKHYAREGGIENIEKTLEQEIHVQDLDFVYNTIEIPLIPILEHMQTHGILIDAGYLKNLSTELHAQLKIAEEKIYKIVGHEFNINSPKQLGEILFGEMQIHSQIKGFKVKKTASGTYSTRESDLEKLAESLPEESGQIIKDIFEYRELQKLLSTYIDNIPAMLDTGSRLHPDLIQTGTTTGRFSSQNPNVQNIPIRSDMGKDIRNAFIAPSGFSIVSADYSQIELRSAAILSGDPVLLETFREGKDIHAAVASRVFHVPESEVTPNQRRHAKVINFGMLYGMGVSALQKQLGTDRKEAQEFHDEYYRQLPKLADYIKDTITLAKKTGYTETLFGRKRHFAGLRSSIPFIKAMAERAASNAPIQGTTADIIKLAMIRVEKKIQEEKLQDKIVMTMQIHDELVFEVADDILDKAKKLIQESMESILNDVPQEIKNKVPLDVSIESGKTWGSAKG